MRSQIKILLAEVYKSGVFFSDAVRKRKQTDICNRSFDRGSMLYNVIVFLLFFTDKIKNRDLIPLLG